MRTTYNILTAVNVRFEEHIVSKDNMRVDIESQMKTIVFIILQNIFAARGIFWKFGDIIIEISSCFTRENSVM